MVSSDLYERSTNLPSQTTSASHPNTIQPNTSQNSNAGRASSAGQSVVNQKSSNGKVSPGDQQKVTVETETVPSVPTLGVLNPSNSSNYTVRVKRSQDYAPRLNSAKGSTKKRSQRMAQGSKADFFAAKVANAVDEQDSSESDETFVYDTTQAPASVNQYGDSFRRSYTRSASGMNPHLQYVSAPANSQDEGYFGDNIVYETDAISDTSGHAERRSPSPSKQGQMVSRNFVVPKSSSNASQPRQTSQSYQSISRSQLPNLAAENAVDDPHWLSRQPRRDNHIGKSGHSQSFQADQISPKRETRDPNDSVRAKHTYLQRWRTPAQAPLPPDEPIPDEEQGERTGLLRGRSSLYNYHSSRSSHGKRWYQQSPSNQQSPVEPNARDSVYSREESQMVKFQEAVSLTSRIIVFVSLIFIVILSMLFVGGALLAAARPLQDFDVVSLSDVFVSDRELVFSMITHARNPGMFSKVISKGEIDVFATSSHADAEITTHAIGPNHDLLKISKSFPAHEIDSNSNSKAGVTSDKKKTRTVWLGSIRHLSSPISFHGGFSSATQWHAASAKLVAPLGNNTELWSSISAYEFDLTVKGILKYKVLGNEHREPVSRAYHVKAPDFDDNYHED